jgi:hypothetical protein
VVVDKPRFGGAYFFAENEVRKKVVRVLPNATLEPNRAHAKRFRDAYFDAKFEFCIPSTIEAANLGGLASA